MTSITTILEKIEKESQLDSVTNNSTTIDILSQERQINQCYKTYLLNDYKNHNVLLQQKAIRMFKDETTDCLTKELMVDNPDIEVYDFVNFMFQYVSYKIHLNINSNLTNNNPFTFNRGISKYMYPLFAGENIFLYFKGGTMMKYFKDKLYDEHAPPGFADQQGNDFAKSFKVSDTDMSIKIKTHIHYRYEQIKNALMRNLSVSLREISEILDVMYNNRENIRNNRFNRLTNNTLTNEFIFNDRVIRRFNFLQSNIENNFKNLTTFFKFLKEYVISYDNEDNANITSMLDLRILLISFFDPTKNTNIITNEDLAIIRRNNNLFNILFGNLVSSNPYENSLFIEFITFIRTYKFKSLRPDVNLDNFMTNTYKKLVKCNKYLLGKMYISIEKLFNTTEQFKNSLINNLTDIVRDDEQNQEIIYDYDKNKRFKINPELFTGSEEDTKDTITKSIDFNAVRSDFILSFSENIASKFMLYEFNDKYKNYVSINNSINHLKNLDHLNFSLLRIKHQVTIKNLLKLLDDDDNLIDKDVTTSIPSEMLDITIMPYYSGSPNYIANNSVNNTLYSVPVNTNRRTTSYIIAQNPEQILNDLNYVLFGQHSGLCWHVPKFEKRFFRLLFYVKLLGKSNNTPRDLKKSARRSYRELKTLLDLITVNGNDSFRFRHLDRHMNLILIAYNEEIIRNNSNKMSLFHLVSVKNDFKIIDRLLIFIILCGKLILSNEVQLIYDIMKYNLEMYNIIDENLINPQVYFNSFKREYINFINKLKTKVANLEDDVYNWMN
jgi:hypothetical protein